MTKKRVTEVQESPGIFPVYTVTRIVYYDNRAYLHLTMVISAGVPDLHVLRLGCNIAYVDYQYEVERFFSDAFNEYNKLVGRSSLF